MKKLSPDQMVSVLPLDMRDCQGAQSRLLAKFPGSNEAAMLNRNVFEGLSNCSSVSAQGVHCFTVYWAIGMNRTLDVIGAVSVLDGECRMDILNDGLDRLAIDNGCHQICFRTERAGLVKAAKNFGYRADSVLMVKKLA